MPSSPSSTACCGPAAACNSPTSSSTRRSQRTRASASTSGRAESPGLSWKESTRASSSVWATSTSGRAISSTPTRARRSRTPAARRPSTGRWAPPSARPSPRDAETHAAERHYTPGVGLESGAETYLLSAGAAVDVFGLRSNEIPDAVRQSVIEQYPRLGFKREFAGLLRAEAKHVPRGRAWYLHRFAMSDLSIRLAPFRG